MPPSRQCGQISYQDGIVWTQIFLGNEEQLEVVSLSLTPPPLSLVPPQQRLPHATPSRRHTMWHPGLARPSLLPDLSRGKGRTCLFFNSAFLMPRFFSIAATQSILQEPGRRSTLFWGKFRWLFRLALGDSRHRLKRSWSRPYDQLLGPGLRNDC